MSIKNERYLIYATICVYVRECVCVLAINYNTTSGYQLCFIDTIETGRSCHIYKIVAIYTVDGQEEKVFLMNNIYVL